MKNIQVIDDAENSVYDIFSATDEEFNHIFPEGTNIAFNDEVMERNKSDEKIGEILNNIWSRPVWKSKAIGIHGILFYGMEEKKEYYPNRRDEDARNPDGTKLRGKQWDNLK